MEYKKVKLEWDKKMSRIFGSEWVANFNKKVSTLEGSPIKRIYTGGTLDLMNKQEEEIKKGNRTCLSLPFGLRGYEVELLVYTT